MDGGDNRYAFREWIKMVLNGSELISNPMNVIFRPWTNMFEDVVGVGAAFWLFMLVVMTFAVYIKTQKPEVTMLFMIGSGAFFSASTAFVGAGDITIAFLVFTAIGLTSLFIKLVYFRGE